MRNALTERGGQTDDDENGDDDIIIINDSNLKLFCPTLGSKTQPPLPPPMGKLVRAFLNICSKPRNLTILSDTEGWNLGGDWTLQKLFWSAEC